MSKFKFTIVVFFIWLVSLFYGSDAIIGVDITQHLASIETSWLLRAVFFYAAAVSCSVIIFWMCLKNVGAVAKKTGIVKGWIFGSFIDNISPTITPLGEISMVYFLNRFYGMAYDLGLAAIGIYASAWGIASTIFAAAVFVMSVAYLHIPPMLLSFMFCIVVIFGCLTAFAIIFVLKKKPAEKLFLQLNGVYCRFYNKFMKKKKAFDRNKIINRFENFYKAFVNMTKNKRLLSTAIPLFLLNQACHAFAIYAIFMGFGVRVEITVILFVHILSMVTGLLVLIPGGLGVYEISSGGWYITLFGINEAVVIPTIFVYRLIFLWTTNLLGMLIGVTQGVKSKHISEIHNKA